MIKNVIITILVIIVTLQLSLTVTTQQSEAVYFQESFWSERESTNSRSSKIDYFKIKDRDVTCYVIVTPADKTKYMGSGSHSGGSHGSLAIDCVK